MALSITQTSLPDVLLVQPNVFEDARGFFLESFNKRDWVAATGIVCDFVQDNHSRSVKGVLRGLHYQLPPSAQGKLVRVLSGEIFDVAVDIRKDSENFGKWTGHKLSAENKTQIWVPEGFAHGFLVLSDVAEVFYKTTSYYSPEDERSILWNDSDISIDWPMTEGLSLSGKDKIAPRFAEAEVFKCMEDQCR